MHSRFVARLAIPPVRLQVARWTVSTTARQPDIRRQAFIEFAEAKFP